jgi:glycosyltransferase involved in cell wall biosynthesis
MPTLPRLLVISDVAVERTGAGSLLLYRLLEDYPPDLLKVFYAPAHSRGAEKRLPRVDYTPVSYAFPRYLVNRHNPMSPLVASFLMHGEVQGVLGALGDFRPEAVMSVANGYLWFTAAALAARRAIPLHLFLHEDWPNLVTTNHAGPVWSVVRAAARRRIGPIYRRAASRFSVSRGMLEEVRERYGVSSTLMYPNRGKDSPPSRVRTRPSNGRGPVVAHTGFIHLEGNAALLRDLARILGELGGHLDLYTMHGDDDLARRGLVGPVVRNVGFFPAHEMAERVAATADALFLSASFDERDRLDIGTLFPSKLADYTAIGLPIITWGPAYSSAVRWCSENPDATLLFTTRDPEPVRKGLLDVLSNGGVAAKIARAAVEAGDRDFAPSVAQRQFIDALAAARWPPSLNRRSRVQR